MARYNSGEIFGQCDRQARRVLSLYERYKAGPAIEETRMTQQEIGYSVLSVLMCVALWFTIQAEIYINKPLMTAVLGTRWLVGVIVVLTAGLFSSIILAELLPMTRVLTAGGTKTFEPDHIDGLMDRLRLVKRRTASPVSTLRRFGLMFIALMVVLLAGLASLQGVRTGNWLPVAFPPVLFLFDCILGVGPVWLVIFVLNRLRIQRENRVGQQFYSEMKEGWNLVAELYDGGKRRFYEEHPEQSGKIENLPAVHPLTAFIITHPCSRDIEIPEHLYKPKDPPPAATPMEDSKGPDPDVDPARNAEPIFSAMDSELDANNEKA